MIAFLKGKIIKKSSNFLILEVANVGYRIFVSESLFLKVKSEEELSLYIHQHVKEDSLELYGFINFEELELFEMLLSVSGVGPKSALGVLNLAKAETIKESIARGDAGLLTKVSGVGKKTAERVVLELRNKMGKLGFSLSENISNSDKDEIDALMALGYSLDEAREVLKTIPLEITDSAQRIREALKKMAKK